MARARVRAMGRRTAIRDSFVLALCLNSLARVTAYAGETRSPVVCP